MQQPIYKCMTKGSDQESGSPRRSANWVVSRRGLFKVYPDRVELGNWSIPFDQIESATEYRIPYLPFIRTSVLELQADGKIYQFGFNPWARPVKYFPIPVEERKASMSYSPFSMIVRVLLLLYLSHVLWVWLASMLN